MGVALKFQQDAKLKREERLHFLYPLTEEVHLPTKWCSTNVSQFVEFSHGKDKFYRCKYKKRFQNYGDDVGSVIADHPIPLSCDIYYFEIKIISQGKEGKISIGLREVETNLHRQPGWERGSCGYHGDDGHKFMASGSGAQYGPTFGTSDVVGCGLNLQNRTCFFTKNGKCLGTAFGGFDNIHDHPLYPTVGLHSADEEVEVNFGQEPFLYNIKLEIILSQAHQKDLVKTNQICFGIDEETSRESKND